MNLTLNLLNVSSKQKHLHLITILSYFSSFQRGRSTNVIPHLMDSLVSPGSHTPGPMEHPTSALRDLITWVRLQWGHKDHLTWGLPLITLLLILITLQWCTKA